MLLSIIVPVYQVENYLKQCLNSVLACDLADCEVLLSLGKSMDRSNQISQEFSEKHSMIRTVFQKGTGLSDARNTAMEFAQGDYLLFLDSDDFVISENLNSVISDLRKDNFQSDVIVTDFYRLSRLSGQLEEIFQIGKDMPNQYEMEFLSKMLRKRRCFWNVWRYIYRRSFLEKHGIGFWENMLSEDVDFTSSVFLAEPKVMFRHSPYYVYCVEREDSLMGTPTLRRLSDTVVVLKKSILRMKESEFAYAKLFSARFQFEYILNMAITAELVPEDRFAAQQLYQDWREVLADSSDWLVRVFRRMAGLLGVPIMARMLHQFKVIRRWRRHHSNGRRAIT